MQDLIRIASQWDVLKTQLNETKGEITSLRKREKFARKRIDRIKKQRKNTNGDQRHRLTQQLNELRQEVDEIGATAEPLRQLRDELEAKAIAYQKALTVAHMGMTLQIFSYSAKKKMLQVGVLEGGKSFTRYLHYERGQWWGYSLIGAVLVPYTIEEEMLHRKSLRLPGTQKEQMAA